MEIGPIRNQNLISWPLANDLAKIGEVGAGRGRKLIGRNPVNLIVGWCGRFLFFVVPRQFSRRRRLQKVCIRRELNPGLPRGRRKSCHWTTDAHLIACLLICRKNRRIKYECCVFLFCSSPPSIGVCFGMFGRHFYSLLQLGRVSPT